MKYQIYLKKEISEQINAIAKAKGERPSTFIKEFLEACFTATEAILTPQQLEEVRAYGKDTDK